MFCMRTIQVEIYHNKNLNKTFRIFFVKLDCFDIIASFTPKLCTL